MSKRKKGWTQGSGRAQAQEASRRARTRCWTLSRGSPYPGGGQEEGHGLGDLCCSTIYAALCQGESSQASPSLARKEYSQATGSSLESEVTGRRKLDILLRKTRHLPEEN